MSAISAILRGPSFNPDISDYKAELAARKTTTAPASTPAPASTAAVPSAPASTAPKMDCVVVEVGRNPKVYCTPVIPAFTGTTPGSEAPKVDTTTATSNAAKLFGCARHETCPTP